ncbi:patatin-like phospholipase domain-containing protein 1 [Alligator sinensis]|uniref:Patatin-like phospholipase domain-containing protein 1 n=1 Tax=Alligator sinensis TaxID=38654 RepID=A0A3Q0GQY2_ALLSI|nr:patatin-like phospholipase domain-containing protein 1 [Alligator sinensis]
MDPSFLWRGGCGFLMFYQMGVMKALQELAPEILRSASKIYGTSSGALIATLVTCGCEIDAVIACMTETVKNMEGTILRYLYPNNRVILNIQKALEKCLPDNAHQLASGRLHIFLTQVSGLQNVVVSEFSSKEEIIQAVTCSFFVPVYNGYIPPSFQGVRYTDGAFSSPEAAFYTKTMITVSGFALDNDICPRDKPGTFFSVYMLQQVFQISLENFHRLVCCIFSPSRLVMHEFFLKGYHDAGFYLERNREFGIDYLARNTTLPLASESHKKCLSQTSGGSWNQNPSTRILTSTDAAFKDLTRQHGAMSRAENETEEKTQQLPLY